MNQKTTSILDETEKRTLSLSLKLSLLLFVALGVSSFLFLSLQSQRAIETKLKTDQAFLEDALNIGDLFFITRYLSAYVESGGLTGAGIKKQGDIEWVVQVPPLQHGSQEWGAGGFSVGLIGTSIQGFWPLGTSGWNFYYSYSVGHLFLVYALLAAIGLSIIIFALFRNVLRKTLVTLVTPVANLVEDLDTQELQANGYWEMKKYNSGIRFIETDRLVNELLRLIGRITDQEALLREAEVFKAITKISRQVRHDVQSPLGALYVACDELEHQPEKGTKLIRSAVARIAGIMEDLRLKEDRMPHPTLKKEKVVLQTLLEELIEEKIQTYRDLNLKIEKLFTGPLLELELDRHQLSRAISNIINNGIEAVTDQDPLIKIRFESTKDHFILVISDNGPGIPAEILPHIFEYGFTHGKQRGEGTGLHQAQNSLRFQGMSLEYNSAENGSQGAAFRIELKKNH